MLKFSRVLFEPLSNFFLLAGNVGFLKAQISPKNKRPDVWPKNTHTHRSLTRWPGLIKHVCKIHDISRRRRELPTLKRQQHSVGDFLELYACFTPTWRSQQECWVDLVFQRYLANKLEPFTNLGDARSRLYRFQVVSWLNSLSSRAGEKSRGMGEIHTMLVLKGCFRDTHVCTSPSRLFDACYVYLRALLGTIYVWLTRILNRGTTTPKVVNFLQ